MYQKREKPEKDEEPKQRDTRGSVRVVTLPPKSVDNHIFYLWPCGSSSLCVKERMCVKSGNLIDREHTIDEQGALKHQKRRNAPSQ